MSLTHILVVAACFLYNVESSQDVMKQMSINFAKPLEACRKELDLSEDAIKEMYNFWKEGLELKNRQTGCAILCISHKLELLDASFQLHHGNAQEFAKKHGADDAMAKQLVDMIHNCGQTVPMTSDDPCQNTLNIAICFKNEIHKLNWAPPVEVIIAELLAET